MAILDLEGIIIPYESSERRHKIKRNWCGLPSDEYGVICTSRRIHRFPVPRYELSSLSMVFCLRSFVASHTSVLELGSEAQS